MSDEPYATSGTSSASANVEDRVLTQGATTRKVLRAIIHENPSDPDAVVRIALIHQRKRADDSWEDQEGASLNTLKAGEAAKFTLSSADTLALRRAQAEFLEMPGLRLTEAQAARLWSFDSALCSAVLSALVESRFLIRTRNASFSRA